MTLAIYRKDRLKMVTSNWVGAYSDNCQALNAIGAYRIPQEHLFIYFFFTNDLTQEQYGALKDKYVERESHGTSRIAFVCQHLLKGPNLGFHETIDSNPPIEPEDDYQAWCDDCEKAWEREGDWTENFKAFVNLKIVCDECYFESKRRNQINEAE